MVPDVYKKYLKTFFSLTFFPYLFNNNLQSGIFSVGRSIIAADIARNVPFQGLRTFFFNWKGAFSVVQRPPSRQGFCYDSRLERPIKPLLWGIGDAVDSPKNVERSPL